MTYRTDYRTTTPLEKGERRELLRRLESRTLPPDPSGLDPRQVVLFLYHTGAHPDVIVHPRLRELRVLEDGSVAWNRPKTDRAIVIPPSPQIVTWVADFVAALPEDGHPALTKGKRHHGRPTRVVDGRKVKNNRPYCLCYTRITRLVKRVATALGMPKITPRTLRHTFAARIYEASGFDVTEVQRWTGTSPSIALRYAKPANSRIGKLFIQGKV